MALLQHHKLPCFVQPWECYVFSTKTFKRLIFCYTEYASQKFAYKKNGGVSAWDCENSLLAAAIALYYLPCNSKWNVGIISFIMWSFFHYHRFYRAVVWTQIKTHSPISKVIYNKDTDRLRVTANKYVDTVSLLNLETKLTFMSAPEA